MHRSRFPSNFHSFPSSLTQFRQYSHNSTTFNWYQFHTLFTIKNDSFRFLPISFPSLYSNRRMETRYSTRHSSRSIYYYYSYSNRYIEKQIIHWVRNIIEFIPLHFKIRGSSSYDKLVVPLLSRFSSSSSGIRGNSDKGEEEENEWVWLSKNSPRLPSTINGMSLFHYSSFPKEGLIQS